MSKSRNYCITMFTEPVIPTDTALRYAIFGEEIAPTTNKTHWQGYIELTKPMRFAAIKKLFNDNTIHIEARKGTREQARDYCKKDNKFTEYGKWISGQGHRSDLDDVVDRLKSGTKLSELMLENPKLYCSYRNGLKDIAAEVTKQQIPKWRDVEVVLISGPTGCGKTRLAMEDATYKIEGSNLDWWQDYDGEETILIDEYANDLKITNLLNLLDGYKLRLNVKGSHTYARWTKVYITTNLRPDELHAKAIPAHRAALFRRITTVNDMWMKQPRPRDKEVQGNTGLLHLEYLPGKSYAIDHSFKKKNELG